MERTPQRSASPNRLGLGRSLRILSGADFLAIRRKDRAVRDAVLRIGWRPREDGETRLGLAVSRRAGSAVKRNRIKRVVREAFRLDRQLYPRGLDLVVMPVDPDRAAVLVLVRRSLRSLTRRIGDATGPGRVTSEGAG